MLRKILREIGLRARAICRMKAGYIMNLKTFSAHHQCSVMEKQQKVRTFLTSTNLKAKIGRFIEENRDNLSPDSYVFSNKKDFSKPLSETTLSARLKTWAEKANVKVNVHPHVFRHTIVGELMKTHPAHVVSAFMGHKSTQVTLDHYCLWTTKDLEEIMINPYNRVNIEELDSENKLDRAKGALKTVMNAIHKINDISEKILPVEYKQKLDEQIMLTMPGLNRVLNNIEESFCSSSVADTSDLASTTSFQTE